MIIAIVILVLTPVAAFAIMANSPQRSYVSGYADQPELTQQQQADLEESHLQMIELRKETIQKMVLNGLLTAEQGQQALEQLDAMAAYDAGRGYAFGYGMMRGGCVGLDADDDYDYTRGRMRGYNWN